MFRESSEVNGDQPVGVMLSVSGFRGIEVKVYEDEGRRRTVEEVATYRVVRPGQLAVNTMWLNYGGLGVSDLEGHVSPAYRSYWIASTENSRFIHHLMRSATYIDGYTSLLTGIRPNSLQMSRDNLMDFPILLPPPADQLWISRFLDRETAEIDTFIADQDELIRLLAERRAATISRAVTKGLDPNVPMKDSGVEWLGEVPSNWSIEKLGWRARIGNGSTPSREEPSFWTEGTIPWLSSTVVNQGRVDLATEFVTTKAKSSCHLPVAQAGSVLVGLTGQGRTRAMAARLTFNSTISQHLAYVQPRRGLEPDFTYWLIVSAYRHLRFQSDGNGGTKGGLTCEELASLRVPVPSLSEQQSIVQRLDNETYELDEAIADARDAIALSRERRTALISAAVTGKIDVREHGAVA